MKKRTLIVLLCLVYAIGGMAQLSDDLGFDENKLKVRVKQLGEFMDRFNCRKDILGNPVGDRFTIDMRRGYIRSLFNEDLQIDSDPVYANFINRVVETGHQVYIDFTDKNWYATANCKAIFNGRATRIYVILKPEKIRDYEYKWVICDAKGDALSLEPEKRNPGMIISPVENEMNFMDLTRIMNNRKNILNYMSAGWKTDGLSVLNALIYNGQLKVERVEKVIYTFRQVPGYIFKVELFERDRYNAGWLISEVIHLDK